MPKHDYSDHVHESAIENGHAVPSYDFDYSAVDEALGFESPAETLDWQDMVGALSLILGFICGQVNRRDPATAIVTAGAKANAIWYWLDPVNARFKSLQEIGDASGMTKAAASKWLVDLRAQLGGILPMKVSGASETYSKAQRFAADAKCHASDVVRRRKAQELADLEAVGE